MKVILMNTDHNSIWCCIYNAYALFYIRYFLRCYCLPFCVDGPVCLPDHNRVDTHKVEKVIKSFSDFQVDLAFKNAGTGHSTPIYASMSCINNYDMVII